MIINEFKGCYRWLSNFWYCHLPYNGFVYPTLEHAYQAQKYPVELRSKFTNTMTAGEAKKLGAVGPHLLSESERLAVMLELTRIKFDSEFNPELAVKLKSLPPDTVFVEGNYWNDKYWGFCLKTNEGENNLGKILKQVHTEVLTK